MNLESVCRDEHRRERVRRFSNGIDYVDAGEDRRTLTVHFFNALSGEARPEQFLDNSYLRELETSGFVGRLYDPPR